MNIELSKSFQKKLKKQVERYQFQVGVLEDKPHRDPVETKLYETPKLGTYAGGPVRKATRKTSGKSNGEILVDNMERLGINILWAPFEDESSDINKFMKAFFNTIANRGSIKRVENLLQAVVRNPILKQAYGSNKNSTADVKGFDRHLIDTGQTFQSIKAKAKRV